MKSLKPRDSLYGFTVGSRVRIGSLATDMIRLSHDATGLDVIHMENDDPENLFTFVVRTPPSDDTGVPHIMEHSVLAGSRNFPLKDPFVQLLKGSMKTLLNASTGFDETQYYAASTNEKDFFNLMKVYGDAVFFPLLKEEIFMQEGIRIETQAGTTGSLRYAGVVYNEMTGRNSHPESLVSDYSIRSLYPDNEYRFESGGEPLSIPELTYDRFLDFYSRYYHPSNVKLFLYGNIPTERSLSYVQTEFLAGFKRKKIRACVLRQKKWKSPRIIEKRYPASRADNTTPKSFVSVNWLSGLTTDPFLELSFELLQEILVGNSGSPLRKALQESGLGEDLLPSTGLAAFLPEMFFSAGLRGAAPENAREIEALVFRVLDGLANDGIEAELIRGALGRLEFRNREGNLDGNYRGIRLYNKILRPWIEGVDPSKALDFDFLIAKLKKMLVRFPKYPERLIRTYFLRNPHRTLLAVHPDFEMAELEKKQVEDTLSRLARDARKLELIHEAEKRFIAFQNTPDSEEMLLRIPSLQVNDLPKSPPSIPASDSVLGSNIPVLCHDIFTSGIVYIDFAFDISGLDPELYPFITLFGKAICSCGIPGTSYDRIARELGLVTGGFYASFDTDFIAGTETTKSYLIFRVKALESSIRRALTLVVSLFTSADFDDGSRMKDMLFELRNRYRSSIVPSGNYYAGARACANLVPPFAIEEKVSGISQAEFLASLLTEPATAVTRSSRALGSIREHALCSTHLCLNVTCDANVFSSIAGLISESVSPLAKSGSPSIPRITNPGPTDLKKTESIACASGVCFNAIALQGSSYITDTNAIEAVLGHYLSTNFLWENVRQKGGAYGAHASSSGMASAFLFSSYRDPHIAKTLAAFRASLEYIQDTKVSESEVVKAIIGTIAVAEKPLSPQEKGIVSLKRKLYGITDRLRQRRRDVVLDCTARDLSKAAEALLAKFDEGFTVTIASAEKIESEALRLPALKDRVTNITI